MERKSLEIHPTKDIQGSKSSKLKNKTICLCLTGSVGIINSPNIARTLTRNGAEVIIVMTQEAMNLMSPVLFEWVSGNPVITEITGKIEHVTLAGEREGRKGSADLILICPATANTIGKIASGISDTPVTAIAMVALGSKTPMVVVPAMHFSMFQNPIVQKNITKLEKLNCRFLNPRIEENKAKVASNEEVTSFVIDLLTKKNDLKGLNFLITAGPSREWIDQVRFLSNPSSGKTGMAFAKEIISRGGELTIINGPGTIDPPIGINVINVESAVDFKEALSNQINTNHYDVFISTSAIADFTPKQRINNKISSDTKELQLFLKPTPKLINYVRSLDKNLFIVAFKAESNLKKEDMIEKAFTRLKSANSDLIIANDVNPKDKKRGFSSDTNEVYVIDKEKRINHLELTSKQDIAAQVLDIIIKKLK